MLENNEQDYKSIAERHGIFNAVFHRVEIPRIDSELTLGGFEIGLLICNHLNKRTVVVDLGIVEHMTPEGLWFLSKLQDRYKEKGGKIVLLDAPDNIKAALEVSGLSEHLPQISSK